MKCDQYLLVDVFAARLICSELHVPVRSRTSQDDADTVYGEAGVAEDMLGACPVSKYKTSILWYTLPVCSV
jgi:hypothetical protein